MKNSINLGISYKRRERITLNSFGLVCVPASTLPLSAWLRRASGEAHAFWGITRNALKPLLYKVCFLV